MSETNLRDDIINSVMIEHQYDNIRLLKAMCRMQGFKWMAIDDNGEVWGYKYRPYNPCEYNEQNECEDGAWQVDEGSFQTDYAPIAMYTSSDFNWDEEIYEL